MNPYEPPRHRDEIKTPRRTVADHLENFVRGAAITSAFLAMAVVSLFAFLALPWGLPIALLVLAMIWGIQMVRRTTIRTHRESKRRRWNDWDNSEFREENDW